VKETWYQLMFGVVGFVKGSILTASCETSRLFMAAVTRSSASIVPLKADDASKAFRVRIIVCVHLVDDALSCDKQQTACTAQICKLLTCKLLT
jgi:hypothetical protein